MVRGSAQPRTESLMLGRSAKIGGVMARMRPAALRIGATAVAAVLVAEAAVWLLRPRGEVLEPAKVSEEAYFTQAQIDRAHDFRDGQRLIALGALALEGAVLVVLALWRPAPARRALAAAARRPLLGGAVVGAGLSLTLAVVALPLSTVAHERSRDVGLATQTIGPWLGDQAKSAAIGAAVAAAGAAVALALMRRLGRRWWIGGSVAVVAFAAVFSWLAPVLLAPIFNRFEELPPGRVRSDVLRLGERAGVDIGEVYRVDASRRSTAVNAYVNGLGPTKRVVLNDNLLREAERPVLNSVVAHELGHVKGDDILRGIGWIAIVAPFGVLFVQLSTEALSRRAGAARGTPAALPALALSLTAATLVLGAVSNQLSRRVEARADTFALELTRDPRAFISLQKQLSVNNVSDPDPPALSHWLFATHPSTVERIGAAVEYEREHSGQASRTPG
jgi:Zn-dependent protease with chaperone function